MTGKRRKGTLLPELSKQISWSRFEVMSVEMFNCKKKWQKWFVIKLSIVVSLLGCDLMYKVNLKYIIVH
jgi:hypothetical protein